MPTIEAGRVVAGRYRIQEQLGEGGMGSVWRAEHVTLKSPVAVKFLNAAIADHPEMLERFMREAQSAAALRGTYVVQIFDYGVEDGTPYIAMELLNGESLQHRLDRQGRLSTAELRRFFPQVARAVSKAHEAGIVHRDLKPDNIFLVKEGDEEIAKVLDFGIAKVDNPLDITTGGGTRTGAMLGTPYYMSPEQARGKKAVDHRTDLWALAIIAYDCLVGKRAFDSDALGDLVLLICTSPTPVPSQHASVPKGFDEWFLRGANKDPDQRFQSVRQMADSLEQALGGAMSPAPITGSEATVYSDNPKLKISTNGAAVITAAPRSAKGSPLLWAGIVAAMLIGGVAFAIFSSGGATQDDDGASADNDNNQKGISATAGPAPVLKPAPSDPSAPVVAVSVPALAPSVSAPSVSAPSVSAPSVSAAPVSPAPAVAMPSSAPADPGSPRATKQVSNVRKQPVKSAQTAAPAATVKPAEMTKPNAADLFSDRQ
jgi:serine/threonine-protein kinase